MRRPRVALVMDHPQRDLAGLVLTAVELCQQGVDCHLVPLNLLREEIWALAPDFVLFNYLRRGNDTTARALLDAGVAVGLLDTEGVVWSDFETYTELLWADRQLLQRVSRICAWGPELADHLVHEGYFKRDSITVTGCPRFDLYHPRWRPLLQNGNGGGVPRRRILINTNFPTANPRFGTVDANVTKLRDTYGWTPDRIQRTLDTERAALDGLLAIAGDLSREFPAAHVVIRPHPHENPTPYRDGLAGSGVEVNATGPVHTQLFQAAAVIQRNCTTAIDAGFAGVPSIAPQWLPAWFHMDLSERVSIPVQTQEELRDIVAAALDGSYAPDTTLRANLADVIERWFHHADGDAYRRVAAALRPHLEPRSVDRDLCLRHLYGVGAEPAWRPVQLGRRVRHALRLPTQFSFKSFGPVASKYWAGTDKFFDAHTVGQLVERVRGLRREQGLPDVPVTAHLARERGEFLRPDFPGHTVTLTSAP